VAKKEGVTNNEIDAVLSIVMATSAGRVRTQFREVKSRIRAQFREVKSREAQANDKE